MKPGDTVICIKNHVENKYTEGQLYTVLDVRKHCNCGPFQIDIGVRDYEGPKFYKLQHCYYCRVININTPIWWVDPKNFVPLEDWNQAEHLVNELTETINQPVEI